MERSNKAEKQVRQGGFTLVELLLVVAILGVLATVAIMNTTGMSEEARIRTTQTSIGTIETAAKTYEIRTGRFPDSMDQLMQPVGDRPALIEKRSGLDSWGVPFAYKKTGSSIEIRSAGPDSAMNTEDDLVNSESN